MNFCLEMLDFSICLVLKCVPLVLSWFDPSLLFLEKIMVQFPVSFLERF